MAAVDEPGLSQSSGGLELGTVSPAEKRIALRKGLVRLFLAIKGTRIQS